jgi:succinyl-diaminopimelate desuccinylase
MNAPGHLDLTRALLRFNTINPPGMERACARHLGKLLEDAGYRCAYHEFADARTTLIAEIGGGLPKPPICFTGHIDTVPLGAAAWSHDAFAGETDGDRLYGRGSSDMKAGIAAIIIAAIRLAPRLRNTPGLVLVLTAGEEVGCEGAKFLVAQKLLDRAGAIVVAEPTGNYPYVGHKGLCWVEIETRGKTAHGSMPEQGENAILKMAQCIHKLEGYRFETEAHPVMGKPTLNIATLHAGLNTNSVPDAAKMTLDMRTVPGIDHAHLCSSLATLLGAQASVRRMVETPPLYTEPDDIWVQSVFDLMTPFLGARPTPATITFSTDGADLKRGYTRDGSGPPTLILGPGEAALAHQTDEWCSMHRVDQAIEVFSAIMKQWCGI